MSKDYKKFMREHVKTFKRPTEEELRKSRLEAIHKDNPNKFSMWFERIKLLDFNFPKTQVIKISDDWMLWLISDSYKPEKIKEFNDYLMGEIADWVKVELEKEKGVFIKTGTYSGKFVFSNCHVTDTEELGKKFLSIVYDSMLVGAGTNNEMVVREFLTDDKKVDTIYDGMALRPEIRIFYDFDNDKLLDWFNYFEPKYMRRKKSNFSEKDFEVLSSNFRKLGKENKKMFKRMEKKIMTELGSDENFKGIWSVDFMEVDGKAYLIDMAIGEQSYYYGELELEEENPDKG
jgi:hypothetical protein